MIGKVCVYFVVVSALVFAGGCSDSVVRDDVRLPLASKADQAIRHVTVYQEKGRFCGWPANNGAWSWGDEILVCFDLHYFKEPDFDIDPTEHHRDRDKPSEVVMARSLDGGETWRLERPSVFSTAKR